MERLRLQNTKSGFPLLVLLRATLVVVVWLPLPALLALAGIYGAYQSALPATPNILAPPPGSATRVFSQDGRPIGGLQRGLDPWVAYDDLPPLLIEAFLAVEDDDFYLHDGVDVRAIARAAWSNLQAGAIQQGGSTITQQVAKMFVGNARTYERKLIELMMARRIEATYSKGEILEAYLNRVYLGAGAYGVSSAARLYFDHSVQGLTLAEAATLAGIASAPSAFEPYDHPERALQRRNLVLGRLETLGWVTRADAEAARQARLILRERGEIPVRPLPWVTDGVRQRVSERHGSDAWRYGALSVTTGLSLASQRAGETSLWRGVARLDHRQGYRGPLRTTTQLTTTEFDQIMLRAWPLDSPVLLRPGLVTAVQNDAVEVWVDGQSTSLGPDAWRWAAPYDPESEDNGTERVNTTGLLEAGDVILLDRDNGNWRLAQLPRLEGALVSVDVDTHYVTSMVGGIDYGRSQYNRVTAGCRQPGSVFKPVIYSLALERGYTLATPILDAPIQLPQGIGIEIWRPRNADGRFRGVLPLREALILSRNLPTVRLFRDVGRTAVSLRAAQLGFTTPMDPTDALSLGASCVHPIDVTTAFSVFADRGHRNDPTIIISIRDGRGELMADHGVFYDGYASTSAVLERAMTALARDRAPTLRPATAYLMTFALSDVVRMGTAHAATALDAPSAGKTGTTNAYDAWFVGFTEDFVTAVWVGSDRNTRPLGRGETGGAVALPIWVEYMRAVLDDLHQGSLTEPRPASVRSVRVDRWTGDLAQEGAPGIWLPFAPGTEPQHFALSPDERDLRRTDQLDGQF